MSSSELREPPDPGLVVAAPAGGPRRALAHLSLNSFWLLAARVAGLGLGLLFSGLLARALGTSGLGQFAFISAVLFIGNAAATFGLDTLLQRDVASARARPAGSPALQETINAVLLIQLGLSAVYIALLGLVAPNLPNQSPATLPALWLASLALIPLAFSTVYSAILRAYERMVHYLLFSLVVALVMAGGGVFIASGNGSLTAAAATLLLAQTAGALAAGWLCRHHVPALRWRWAWPSRLAVGRALRLGSVLAALMLLAVLYQRSGVLLLSLLEGDVAAGSYSAAARVLEALKLVPGAFFGALFPVMAREQAAQEGVRSDSGTSRQLYARTFAGLLIMSSLLAVATALLAPFIVRLLFGPGYEAAAAALRIMCWSLPLTVITFKLSFDLVIRGRERLAATSMALTLLIGGGLTAWLITRAGLAGAAWGLVGSEMAQVAILLSLGRAARGRG